MDAWSAFDVTITLVIVGLVIFGLVLWSRARSRGPRQGGSGGARGPSSGGSSGGRETDIEG